jgi:hypothetical protein
MNIHQSETNRDRLLFLCKDLEIDKMTDKEMQAAQTFPYLVDSDVTDDFILGAQNMILVMIETFVVMEIDSVDLVLLSKCYLYHWWIKNIENEFTETEI